MTPRFHPLLASPLAVLAACTFPPPLSDCDELHPCGNTGSTAEDTVGDAAPTTGDGVTATGEGTDAEPSTGASEEESGASTSDPTDAPVEPPLIVERVVMPDYIEMNGLLDVDVTAEHADGVRMLLDDGVSIELLPAGRGEFVGQIAAFTGLDNGPHTALFTPWREAVVGATVGADYVIALPAPGSESGWHTGEPDVHGSVAAIAVLPDGRPVEIGTFDEMGASRCYLRMRGTTGEPLEFVPLLAGAECRATDLKIDAETGVLRVLVEREGGKEMVWWAGEISAWGKGVKEIGMGVAGDTAYALAAQADVVAVCGSRAVATVDKLDALAVLLRANEAAEVRVFDYSVPGDPQPQGHKFTETARDCIFAEDALVLVGEVNGRHDGELTLRDRLMMIESAVVIAGEPTWRVAGSVQGVQTRAHAVDRDGQGRLHVVGSSCFDVCEPIGELWSYAADGMLVEHTSLGPLGSSWFGPHDVAWSPAGYAAVALGGMQGQSFVFKVQAFAPGAPVPLWTFIPNEKQGLQLALAVAVGLHGEVYAGGVGAGDYPAFARVGG